MAPKRVQWDETPPPATPRASVDPDPRPSAALRMSRRALEVAEPKQRARIARRLLRVPRSADTSYELHTYFAPPSDTPSFRADVPYWLQDVADVRVTLLVAALDGRPRAHYECTDASDGGTYATLLDGALAAALFRSDDRSLVDVRLPSGPRVADLTSRARVPV